jgi:signal transduction histidine kinase
VWKLIDNRTLLLATTFVVGAFAPLLLLIKRTHRAYPGFEQWALGLACFGLSALLQGVRGLVNDFFPIVIGNGLAFFGLILLCDGVHRFCDRPWRATWAYAGAWVCLAIVYWFRYVQADEQVRIVVFTLFELIFTARCGTAFLGSVPPRRRLSYRFCAVVSAILTFALAIRLVAAFVAPAQVSVLYATTPNSLYCLSVLLGTVSVVLGVFLLTWERLVQELHEANQSAAAESAERLRMEKRVAEAERMASIGRLAGGIAHYFNNQMCVINGYCHLLLRPGMLGEPARTTVSGILKAGEDTAQLTDRLLAFSQVKFLRPSKFQLATWIGGIAPEVVREIGERVKVTFPDPACETSVQADTDWLGRVILAMARNARDAMPRGGEFSMGLDRMVVEDGPRARELDLRPDTYACLTLRDNGGGMDEKTLRHVFEPFFTTKGLANAEGLSLASALGFAKQSGGTITVESAPRVGTTFRVFLPMAQ